ncbi:MAG: hypothetical protein ACTSU5_05410 [Promethearchaeota archaeon]
MKIIKIVSLAITVAAFLILNWMMFQIDIFNQGETQLAPVMLVIVIALFAAFIVLIVFLLMRLKKMK